MAGRRRDRNLVAAVIAAVCLIGSAAAAGQASASPQPSQVRFELASPAGRAAVPPPPGFQICQQSAKGGQPVQERFDWCDAITGILTFYVNKVPEGTATINMTFYGLWGPSSRVWQVSQGFSEIGCTGALCGQQVYILGTDSCSATCVLNYNAGYKIPVPLAPAGDSIATGVVSFGTATTTSTVTMTVGALSTLGPAAGTISRTTTGVRCDSNPLGQQSPSGCVNPSYIPSYELSASKYPDISAFDLKQIQAHPQWGTLTRTVIPAVIDSNRAAACKGFKKQNSTDSCDEFPYASTYEGGLGPPPAAQEHVPLSENSAQGGDLGNFYTSNRLLNGDKFHVTFVP